MKQPAQREVSQPLSTSVSAETSPHLILQLQQKAGNRAVSGLLTPAEGAVGGEYAPVQRSGFHVQRELILTATTGSDSAAGRFPVFTADELSRLNVEATAELRRLAGNAIGNAVEQFHRGCDAVKSELEKTAKQPVELIALVADVIGGFAAPALAGRLLTDIALRKTLTAAGKNARVGNLEAMVNEINALQALKERGAD